MIITDATRFQLEQALSSVTQKYDGNIEWNRSPEALNLDGRRFRLTLRCISSKAAGHAQRANPFTGRVRRNTSACWHVHGDFFDALPQDTIIQARGRITHPGAPWADFNIGSVMFPQYASEACECGSE